MNDMSLSRLYRRLVSARPAVEIDAKEFADVVSAAPVSEGRRDAIAENLASSPAHAALARLLRALKPESEALATEVGESRRAAHPLRQRELRVAAGARRGVHVRWVGGIAACFAVVFGLWSWEGSQRHASDAVANAAVSPSASRAADRIFTTQDRIFASTDSMPRSRHADHLFRANFSSGG